MTTLEPRRERKVVTVLFADLVGFTGRSETLDPEDVEAILRPYHERLRDELERRGGTVEKFIGDAVMAVFGAPVSHEDDPERAVRAAIAIRDWARESDGLQVRIGVNTGEALVNLDARAAAGEGMVAGDVVNTAARLQSAAPTNGILVGEHAYNATKHVVEYRAAEGVEAKGKAEPVHVWEAVQARSRFGVDVRQWSRAPLVGRERERTLLVETLKRVRSGRSPQLVTLVGVPGIGKSRLVYELFQSIERGDELIAWRQGRSLPYGEGVPFWAFAELTKAHAGILEDDAPDAAVGKLEAAVESIIPEAERDWVAGQLRPLVGLEADGDTGADRRTESFAAWRRFVEGVAEQRPLVLVFDDLHWADEGLLDFIDHLVEWAVGVPLLVVCTARPELFERRPGWGGGKLNALTLALSPLEEADAARLIASVLEQAVLPAATQRALLDRAGGNPLYAEQYARLYVERGPGADLPLPESVHGLIAARVDALPLAEKALLQDAAVMGKIFWSGALGGNGALPERLHSLERKDFIRRERQSSVAGELEYAFRHVLVRDVAYGQIPRAERAEKHRAAAEWIEALGRPQDHAELLAHHYISALELARAAGQEPDGLAARAAQAAVDAATRAFALHAHATAAEWYERALDVDPARADRPQLLFRLAHARHLLGEARSADALETARDALLVAGDVATAAEAEALLAELWWHRGQRDVAYSHLDAAEQLARGTRAEPAKARVLAQVARFRMLAGKNEDGIRIGREALALAESLDLPELVASTLATVGTARVNRGEHGAIEDLRRSIDVALGASSVEASRAYNNLGACLYFIGDVARATDAIEHAVEHAERLGNARMLRYARGALASHDYELGRWDEALTGSDEILHGHEGEAHYLAPGALRVRAAILLARGEIDAALREIEEAVARARAAKDPQALVPTLIAAARIYAEAERLAEATSYLDEFIAHPVAPPLAPVWATWHAHALGRALDVRRVVDGAPESRWKTAALGILDRDYALAATMFREIGVGVEEAYAHLRAAEQRASEGRHARAEPHVEQALDFYRSVGATFYIRRAEQLLRA